MKRYLSKKINELVKIIESKIIKVITYLLFIITIPLLSLLTIDWGDIWSFIRAKGSLLLIIMFHIICSSLYFFIIIPKYIHDKVVKITLYITSLLLVAYMTIVLYRDYQANEEYRIFILIAIILITIICFIFIYRSRNINTILRSFFIVNDVKHVGENVKKIANIETKTKDSKKKENLNHIAYFYDSNNGRMLEELEKYEVREDNNNYPHSTISSFQFVIKAIQEINDRKGNYIWFINLLDPKVWFQNNQWKKNYIERIFLEKKKKKALSMRRLHILKKGDYYNRSLIKDINTMLILEWLVGIENKILLIDTDKVESWGMNSVFGGEYLIDYVLFNSTDDNNPFEAGKRFIACSDVIPYFLKKNEEMKNVKVYNIKNNHSFSRFYENFLTFWHFNTFVELKKNEEAKKITNEDYNLFDLFDLLKAGTINTNDVDWKELAVFIKENISHFHTSSTEVIRENLTKSFDKFIKESKIGSKKGQTKNNFNNNFNNFKSK